MIYVFAIVETLPDRPLPAVGGFGDELVTLLTCDGIGAAVWSSSPAALSPTAENAWRHEQVVEALMADRALLPVRFGATFTDEQALHAILRNQAPHLKASLEQVRGCVELGLRVFSKSAAGATWVINREAPPPLVDGISGRDYMLTRLATEQRARESERQAGQIAAALHDKLTPGARGAVVRTASSPKILLTAAYLIRREEVESFTARVQQLAISHPNLRLLCTGPWPPYHFVSPLVSVEAAHV